MCADFQAKFFLKRNVLLLFRTIATFLMQCMHSQVTHTIRAIYFSCNVLSFALAGYPYNLDFDFSILAQFQSFSINNLGDPFIESNYGVHSRQFEVAVLDWFAHLWELQQDEYWGYITNCSTEGNLHGLLQGWVPIYLGLVWYAWISREKTSNGKYIFFRFEGIIY